MTSPLLPSTRLIGVIREAYGLDLGGHRMPALFDCLRALDRDVEKAADDALRSAAKLAELVECATNNETFFFRHAEQLAALQSLVAESVAKTPRSSLRVWVAGCSSGEEAISIAAVLREALFLAPGTSLSVLGTDLNRSVLRKAHAGYGMWSFRGVTPELRAAHFVEQDGRYQPAAALRALVTYKRHNLLEGPPEAVPFDVVSCRNVLIYFEPSMVKRAIDLLALAVAPGGILLLGPAEAPGMLPPDFEMVTRNGVTLLRRNPAGTIAPSPRKTAPPVARRSRGRPIAPVRALEAATRSSERRRRSSKRPPPPRSTTEPSLLPAALAALEAGNAEEAIESLRAAIAEDASDAMARYVLGSVLEARGEHDAAELHYRDALAGLAGRAPDLPVPGGGGITVEELARFLGSVLDSYRERFPA